MFRILPCGFECDGILPSGTGSESPILAGQTGEIDSPSGCQHHVSEVVCKRKATMNSRLTHKGYLVTHGYWFGKKEPSSSYSK